MDGAGDHPVETIMVSDKTVPAQAVQDFLRAIRADQTMVDLFDNPKANALYNARLFFRIVMPPMTFNGDNWSLIRSAADLREFWNEEVSGLTYPLRRFETLLLNKLASGADVLELCKSAGNRYRFDRAREFKRTSAYGICSTGK